jgi:hypothetical protein
VRLHDGVRVDVDSEFVILYREIYMVSWCESMQATSRGSFIRGSSGSGLCLSE